MKSIIFLSTLFFSNYLLADLEKSSPLYKVGESKVDSKLSGNSAVYQFNFEFLNESVPLNQHEIKYQINNNGVTKTVKLNEKGEFKVSSIAGKHNFTVFFSSNYQEIYTAKIPIKAKNRLSVTLYLKDTQYEIIEEKPVIYLYPEIEKNISVLIDNGGELTFTYPKYESGWNVVANPNGKITHKGNEYNYLFWEGKKDFSPSESLFSDGFVVNGSNTLEFLEKQLTAFGFTSEEKADFITFWGPRMAADKEWFVHFVVNEECQQFADVQFEPKPDHFYRFYILLTPLGEVKNQLKSEPKAQVLTPMKREGFVAFEWGGSYIHSTNL